MDAQKLREVIKQAIKDTRVANGRAGLSDATIADGIATALEAQVEATRTGQRAL